MADLNRKTEHFIDMLLDVAGKARLMDLASVDQEQAAAMLQAYANAHPERDLSFDGHVLTESPAQATQPVAAVEQPMTPPVVASPWEMPVEEVAPQASIAPPSHEMFGVAPAEIPPGVPQYDFPQAATDSPGSLADIVPEVAQPYAVPEIQPAAYPSSDQPYDPYAVPGEYGVTQPSTAEAQSFPQSSYPSAADEAAAGMQVPEYAAEYPLPVAATTYDAASEPGGEAWQTPASTQAYEEGQPPVASDYVEFPEFADSSAKVSPLWWLAVVFFGFLGALVAWFVNRGKPGSKPFLIVAIVYVVIVVLGTVAALLLAPQMLQSVQP